MGTTILGMGRYHPENEVRFETGRRFRVKNGEDTQLSMGIKAAREALEESGLTVDDIDLIIAACAVIIQPIPCNAALYHEALGAKQTTAAFDVSSTCTSFITALDTADCLIKAGRYKRILIISSDLASIALNPDEAESFSLFSDGAAAAVVGEGDGEVIGSVQYTLSEGAHLTEIKCGGTSAPPYEFTENRINDYRFTMNGIGVVRLTMGNLPRQYNDFLANNGISADEIDMTVPHQASYALGLIMKKVRIKKEKYIDIFEDYGNMVAASVPFALSHARSNSLVKKGDRVLLVGTAAGLHINMLLLKL